MMLTVIFAVYALALLAALLIFGSLSDRTGRRPVILAALTLEGVALVLFLTARGIEWLVFARLIQGFATGLATTSLGAAMLDIDRQGGALTNALATIAGTAFGAVGSGLLAQCAPAPRHLPALEAVAPRPRVSPPRSEGKDRDAATRTERHWKTRRQWRCRRLSHYGCAKWCGQRLPQIRALCDRSQAQFSTPDIRRAEKTPLRRYGALHPRPGSQAPSRA